MKSEFDDARFFEEYEKMFRSKGGLSASGEWRQLEPLFPDVKGKKILDPGCGYGRHCRYGADHGADKVPGLDFSQKMIAKAREINGSKTIEYRICGIEEYAYPANTWDCIISNLALHYIENLDAVYRKVYRTLKKEGIFLFYIEHPVFTAGIHQEWIYDQESRPLYCQVARQHHTLTRILSGLLQNNFELLAVEDVQPSEEMPAMPGMKDEICRPMMVLVQARARKTI